MAFNKETGKQAGKKSKRSSDNQLKELREVYSKILETNTDNIQKWFNEVAEDNPAKALELMLKMGSYVIPKPRSVELKIPNSINGFENNFENWNTEDLLIIARLNDKYKKQD